MTEHPLPSLRVEVYGGTRGWSGRNTWSTKVSIYLYPRVAGWSVSPRHERHPLPLVLRWGSSRRPRSRPNTSSDGTPPRRVVVNDESGVRGDVFGEKEGREFTTSSSVFQTSVGELITVADSES